MKSFKIREGNVVIDGITYQSNPVETKVKGKIGNILSIMISGKGQWFPVYGEFNDTGLPLPIVEDMVVEERVERLMGERTTKVRKAKVK